MFMALLTMSGSYMWKDNLRRRALTVFVILRELKHMTCARPRQEISMAARAFSLEIGVVDAHILGRSCMSSMLQIQNSVI